MLRIFILHRDPLCRRCQRRASTDVDHIIPLRDAEDLALDPANLQGLCHECHSAKTAAGK